MRSNFFRVTCLLLVSFQIATAQYFYKDILSNQYARAELDSLKKQGVKKIKVHSFEADGKENTDFICEKKISKNFQLIETTTQSSQTSQSLLVAQYNSLGQLLQTNDSSELAAASTIFAYDDKNRISSIISSSHSADDDFNTSLIEEHLYSYNAKGQPQKMWRIRNTKDTVAVEFKLDEKGNITDEIERGVNGKHYYYYYNAEGRLTDIVKYHQVKQKLLPDFMFEYYEDGQIAQMITVDEGVSSNYNTWTYLYNNSLRIIEKCFSKEKKLLGYFEYEYD